MSKNLQILLGITTPSFHTAMRRLESSTGGAAIDAQLLGDILKRAHAAMRKIGLDPRDTTAEELYHALVSRDEAPEIFAKTQYAGLIVDGQVISLNYEDITKNRHRNFTARELNGLRECLAEEVVARYSSHPQTDEKLVAAFAKDAGIVRSNRKAAPNTTKISVAPFILTIGDIVTDAFIKLREDQARIDVDKDGSERLSMDFGSKPPYEQVDIVQAVGNSANASVAFARLGLQTGLMAFLGDDQPGKDSLEYLANEGVDTSTVAVARGMKSNYHFALRYGADRTILIKYEDYDYAWQQPKRQPDWIYLSMISKSAWQLHKDMVSYLDTHPETKLVFQPGTFHFEWGTKKLAKIYKRSELVVMNREEAALVTGKKTKSIAELATALHALGPRNVVITDGPHGSYASDGNKLFTIPNYPDPAPPYDRTGAGDAFCSTITAALALGETLETGLTWAPINSMSVVQQLGAQAGLLSKKDIEKFLAKAPKNYKPTEMK